MILTFYYYGYSVIDDNTFDITDHARDIILLEYFESTGLFKIRK